jgi:hypothetical protein
VTVVLLWSVQTELSATSSAWALTSRVRTLSLDMGELRACQKLWSGRGYAKAQRLDRRQAYWSLNSAISHLGPDMLVPGSGWPRIAGEQAEQQQVGWLS